MTERKAFEENLPAHSGVERHYKKPDDYANHHVQNDWAVWQTAWQASRKVSLDEAAAICTGIAIAPSNVVLGVAVECATKIRKLI